ncbi:hypothetical protein DL768_009655 [Monosporascus sp. mg162]|nr:hypothetical protein DL768_009655 [Monosporascus sp. mg162]
MSLPRLIPVHYVSTVGVGTYSGLEFREVSATPHPPPTDRFDGYIASKWTPERYLEKVAEHCGWPVWIHRPSSAKHADIPDLDLMQNLSKYCKFMHAVPVSTNLRGELDLVTPATVVRSIIGQLHDENSAPGWVRFLHQSGNIKLAFDDMKTFMERELERPVKGLAIGEWARKAAELGLHKVLVAFFKNVVNLCVNTLIALCSVTLPKFRAQFAESRGTLTCATGVPRHVLDALLSAICFATSTGGIAQRASESGVTIHWENV